MQGSRYSAVEELHSVRRKLSALEAWLASMTDEQFLQALDEGAVDGEALLAIVFVPLREKNIERVKENCRMCVDCKDMTRALKTYTEQDMVQLLNSVDDATFVCLAKHERVADLVAKSPSLSERHRAIGSIPAPKSTSRYTISPPRLNYDIEL